MDVPCAASNSLTLVAVAVLASTIACGLTVPVAACVCANVYATLSDDVAAVIVAASVGATAPACATVAVVTGVDILP